MPMAPSVLSSAEALIAKIIQKTSQRLTDRVDRGIADVEAHAVLGLTKAARQAIGGKATIAEIRKSVGATNALVKLSLLETDLVEVIEDARDLAYRNARKGWALAIPPQNLRANPGIAQPGEIEHARNLIVGGQSLDDQAEAWIDQASRTLEQTMVLAATDGGPGATSADEMISEWAIQAAKAITTKAISALEDSLRTMDRLAARDCVLPSLLQPDPTLG